MSDDIIVIALSQSTVCGAHGDGPESRETYHVVVDDLLEAFAALFQALLQRTEST